MSMQTDLKIIRKANRLIDMTTASVEKIISDTISYFIHGHESPFGLRELPGTDDFINFLNRRGDKFDLGLKNCNYNSVLFEVLSPRYMVKHEKKIMLAVINHPNLTLDSEYPTLNYAVKQKVSVNVITAILNKVDKNGHKCDVNIIDYDREIPHVLICLIHNSSYYFEKKYNGYDRVYDKNFYYRFGNRGSYIISVFKLLVFDYGTNTEISWNGKSLVEHIIDPETFNYFSDEDKYCDKTYLVKNLISMCKLNEHTYQIVNDYGIPITNISKHNFFSNKPINKYINLCDVLGEMFLPTKLQLVYYWLDNMLKNE